MLSLGWLERNGSGLVEHSEELITTARAFVMERWVEREHARAVDRAALSGMSFDMWAAEYRWNPPHDLTNACKFASLFTKLIFGGSIQGNADHQFNVINRQIVDLTAGSEGLSDLSAPYAHDPVFFGNDEHLASLASCMTRVRQWADKFGLEHAPSTWLAPAKTRRGMWEIRIGWLSGGREEFSLGFETQASRDDALIHLAEATGATECPGQKGYRATGRLLAPGDIFECVDPSTPIRISPSGDDTASIMKSLGLDTGSSTTAFDRHEWAPASAEQTTELEPSPRLAKG